VAYAEQLGALRPGVLAVHLCDATREELARVAQAKAPVVLCPRSNLFIELKLPPLFDMLEVGLTPGLGTDSLASNASLDVLAEARALADRFPSVPAWELFKMATWNGARALDRTDVGRIARGSRPGIYFVEGAVPGDAASFLLANLRAPRRLLASRMEGAS
jgi:cytosine/adenosine deaminase-related metal-dependent hydrolase